MYIILNAIEFHRRKKGNIFMKYQITFMKKKEKFNRLIE